MLPDRRAAAGQQSGPGNERSPGAPAAREKLAHGAPGGLNFVGKHSAPGSLSARNKMGRAGIRVSTAAAAALLALASCAQHRQPSNDTVFVSDEIGGVTLLDGATGKIEGHLATGPRPRGMAFSPDRRTFYVAASNANRIEVWDVRSHRLLRAYASGTDPERFAISPDGKTAYTANQDHSAVSFLDLPSGRITREVKVGPEPEGVGVSPDGKLVVDSLVTLNLVHFIYLESGQ